MAFENSAVHDMILEYLERLPQDHTPVKAGILERSVMRAIAPKKLFPNPDDEFTDPKIGPNDSIIMNYSQIARWNRARDLDVYEESIRHAVQGKILLRPERERRCRRDITDRILESEQNGVIQWENLVRRIKTAKKQPIKRSHSSSLH